MGLAENIRFLRKKLNLSQEELADLLGYRSYTTIQKWESGVSEPPLKSLGKMSEIFHVNMDVITTENLIDNEMRILEYVSQYKNKTQKDNLTVRIPILCKVAAGTKSIYASDEIVDWTEISADMAKRGTFFGLRVSGDSMEPTINDGDLIIIRMQSDVENGQIAVVVVDGEDGYCKRIQKYNDGTIALVSDNTAYPPKYFHADEIDSVPVRIVGIVKELRRSL